ncbi:fimbrial protein [Enterobacter asburiae]|jgi:type 1 fimbria pilin|uniref:fimbrial protein n=1 Tax=Enterobacter asburiae TaxID=61645 RepID=UPI0018C2D8F2|nr:fimbrial protein [Enterobacter asburiae]MBF9771261.1 fimbrial protein [Enterobacter asburiae]
MNRYIFLILFLLPLKVFAVCDMGFSTEITKYDFNFGSVIVQRDTPVGTTIKTVNPGELFYNYARDMKVDCSIFFILTYPNAQATNYEGVYSTNIPGVGIKVYQSTSVNSGYAIPYPGYNVRNISYGGFWVTPPQISLVKTGDIVSGTLNNGNVSEVHNDEKVSGKPGDNKVVYNLSGLSTVTQVACSITSGETMSFNMGDVPAGQFTAIGNVSEQTKTVNLGLDCDAQANINITLQGDKNPDSADESVIAVTGQGQGTSGVADGVGVQLLYNNAPLELNKMLNLKRSAGGVESFPITARYIQTKDKVKPGNANATAVLNLTYQ